MPTTETIPARPNRETWLDWDPNTATEKHVTIDDLLAGLARLDEPGVTADRIRFWQKAGVLPFPTKKWHDGATRALYPLPSAATAIMNLAMMQRAGYTLDQIGPQLRALLATRHDPDPLGIADMIANIAHRFECIRHIPATAVQIKVLSADGEERVFHYQVPPNRSENTQR